MQLEQPHLARALDALFGKRWAVLGNGNFLAGATPEKKNDHTRR